jgi:hypothetical protein
MASPTPVPAQSSSGNRWVSAFPLSLGLFLGLALVKFGNTAILDSLVERPTDVWELIYQAWPLSWGIGLLAIIAIWGLSGARFETPAPTWLALLPMAWLGWQFLASFRSVDPAVTRVTLAHFAGCTAAYYVGLLALSGSAAHKSLWYGILGGGIIMLVSGLQQHFGGLEETRRMMYESDNWKHVSSDFLARMSSNRIFATVLYPNAFAGALLLLGPLLGVLIWQSTTWLGLPSRCFLTGLMSVAILGCLAWTESKAGWLIALAMAFVSALQVNIPKRVKWAAVVIVVLGGGLGFFVRYESYFQKGARSAGARIEYWKAAVRIAASNPLLGTGPGTFQRSYARIKPPEAEMARLAHNDYLQQASDSGLPGFALYFGFIFASLYILYRKSTCRISHIHFAVWLGTFGLALQGFVEFGLYITALSWPMFFFLGWLWANQSKTSPPNGMDKPTGKK